MAPIQAQAHPSYDAYQASIGGPQQPQGQHAITQQLPTLPIQQQPIGGVNGAQGQVQGGVQGGPVLQPSMDQNTSTAPQPQQAPPQSQPQPIRHDTQGSLHAASPVGQHPQMAGAHPVDQAQAQQQQQKAQQGPPYVWSPNGQYPDEGAQAWAKYYAAGGTDPAGRVYFTPESLPPEGQAPLGVPSQDAATEQGYHGSNPALSIVSPTPTSA